MEDYKNTYVFNKNIVSNKEMYMEVIHNYTYEKRDDDELIFTNSIKEASEKFNSENRDDIKTLYGGSFPKDLVTEAKEDCSYSAFGLVKKNGQRKFYVYPN